MEIKRIKKSQRETTLEIETIVKKSGTIDDLCIDASETEYKRWKRESQVQKIPKKHGHNNQRKCKMQKDPKSKNPGNPGHNEKAKPTDNRYR